MVGGWPHHCRAAGGAARICACPHRLCMHVASVRASQVIVGAALVPLADIRARAMSPPGANCVALTLPLLLLASPYAVDAAADERVSATGVKARARHHREPRPFIASAHRCMTAVGVAVAKSSLKWVASAESPTPEKQLCICVLPQGMRQACSSCIVSINAQYSCMPQDLFQEQKNVCCRQLFCSKPCHFQHASLLLLLHACFQCIDGHPVLP